MTIIFLTFTPLATAAVSEAPDARRSYPKRVRLRTSQNTTPTSTAMSANP